jgi:aerobic-type carbon monoxide dehydrogenase small subunit (CoxS/CutS family)
VAETLALTVDGMAYSVTVDPHRTLLRCLRDDLGRIGPKEGCDDSECGACMVLVDGRPVNSCSFLALQAAGRSITTVESLGSADHLHPLQRAFLESGGIQCGFCTPGMLISAVALLEADPDPTDDAIREALAGNLCRCTGYQPILAAVQRAAAEIRGAGGEMG